MKVAFLGAVPFSLIFGGGETQLINTMNALKNEDVDVEFFDYWDRYYTCDILHVFGCHHWSLPLAMLAKTKGIKIALSTISYNPKPGLPYKLWRYIDPLVPVDTTYRLSRKLISIADVLLPNSQSEAYYLKRFFHADDSKIKVIHNAADLRYANGSPEQFIKRYGLENFVLCVGKIEPRKNQLKLVKALEGTDIKLVLIGSPIPQRIDYFNDVLEVIKRSTNILHIESVPHNSDLLASAYAASKVHVLLGENETPGIVNLEAGIAGANLVVAECPPVREYLGDFADYCRSDCAGSILGAISKALSKPKTTHLKELIIKNYTWQITAQRTLDAYKTIC